MDYCGAGVTFTTTYTANTLVLEIDAVGRNGGWASAVSVDALQIKNVGSFASVSMSGPGGAWIAGIRRQTPQGPVSARLKPPQGGGITVFLSATITRSRPWRLAA
jgi:hypothetical protein